MRNMGTSHGSWKWLLKFGVYGSGLPVFGLGPTPNPKPQVIFEPRRPGQLRISKAVVVATATFELA